MKANHGLRGTRAGSPALSAYTAPALGSREGRKSRDPARGPEWNEYTPHLCLLRVLPFFLRVYWRPLWEFYCCYLTGF